MSLAGTTYSWVLKGIGDGGNINSAGHGESKYADGTPWHQSQAGVWTEDSAYEYAMWYIDGVTFPTTGNAITTNYTQSCKYIKVDTTFTHSSNKVQISGTNDNGVTWLKMKATGATAETSWDSSNKWMTFDSESADGVHLGYSLSSNGRYTPAIDKVTVIIGDIQGSSSGVPESGNKVEWSDDISWNSNDIPYPPSFSAWQTYTSPKLQLTEGQSYWMVMYHNSGAGESWNYYYDPDSTYSYGKIMYGNLAKKNIWSGNVQGTIHTNDGVDEYSIPAGDISFQLGWTEGEITATATNDDSIDLYGRHFKVINDSTINTLEAAQARADREVAGMETIPKKGTITIDGKIDISENYRFSSNFDNFQIDEIWDIVPYTQKIDQAGFQTIINYGKHPFDITKKISDLENKVL